MPGFGSIVDVNAPMPDVQNQLPGAGYPEEFGSGGDIMGLLSMLSGPLGKVLGMAAPMLGGGKQAPELPEMTWNSMPNVSEGVPMMAGLPGGGGGGGGPTAAPTQDPMLFAGAPAGLVKGKSKIQKQTEDGSKKGANPDENKMGGWDKAAIAASVASGLLNQGGPALPNVGFSPGQPVSSNFMV